MLIAELKELIKGYNEEELRILITQMYKAIPKNLRENKEIDEMLKDIRITTNIKTNKTELKQKDFNNLKGQVELFIEYAYKSYYYAPNQFIHKKDRPKWRFIVIGYMKDLQKFNVDTDEGIIATELLEKLYAMLCYGCGYYIFNSDNPFRSIRIDQAEILNIILSRKFAYGINNEVIRSAILLTINHRANWDIIHTSLINTLLMNFKSPDSRVIALSEAISFKKELDNKKLNLTKKTWNNNSEFEHEEKVKNVIELICKLYMELCEYEDGIWYFKKNRKDVHKEISLYLLLDLLEDYELLGLWQREYEEAVDKKIKPREELIKKYHFIEKNRRFPEFQELRNYKEE